MRRVIIVAAVAACHRAPAAMQQRGGELVVDLAAPGMTARELSPVAMQLEARLATISEISALRTVIRDGLVREVIRPAHDLDALDTAVQAELERAARTFPPQVDPPRRWQRGYPVGGYVVSAPDPDTLAAAARRLEGALGAVPGIRVTACGEPAGKTCAAIDSSGRGVAVVEIAIGGPHELADTGVAVVRTVADLRTTLPAGVAITEVPRETPVTVALATDDITAAISALHAAAPSALIEVGAIDDHARSARVWGGGASAVRALPVVVGAGVPHGEIIVEGVDATAVANAARSLAHGRTDVVAVYGIDEISTSDVRREPIEIDHVNGLPAAIILVEGAPGTPVVPAGLRVEVRAN